MSQYSLSVVCPVVSLADGVLSGCTVGQLVITCNILPFLYFYTITLAKQYTEYSKHSIHKGFTATFVLVVFMSPISTASPTMSSISKRVDCVCAWVTCTCTVDAAAGMHYNNNELFQVSHCYGEYRDN